MAIWKSTLITGGALSMLIALGVINTATGGHKYHGSGAPDAYEQQGSEAGEESRHFKHPVYGHAFKHPVYGFTFKHPVHGYKFKHPVYGFMPINLDGQSSGNQSLTASESEIPGGSAQ